MRMYVCTVALLVTCICFMQCEVNATCNQEKKSLNVITFNVGLRETTKAGFDYIQEKKKNILNDLKESDADVVCLQSVIFGRDVEEFVDKLQDKFPFSFSGIHNDVNDIPPQALGKRKPPCDKDRLTALLGCVVTAGCDSTTNAPDLLGCMSSNCYTEVQGVFEEDSQECISCIAMSLSNFYVCMADDKPIKGGRQINIGGLLLLSKRNLYDASYNDYHPSTKELLPRGYIKAEIGDIATVFCTHFSDSAMTFFEPGLLNEGFTSYEDMIVYQTKALIQSVHEIQPAIILGSLNTGIALGSKTVPIVKDCYVQLLKRFTTMPSIQFTYHNRKDGRSRYIVDHVFVKNMIIRKTKKVFVNEDGYSNWSSHTAVQAVVKAA